MPPEVTLLPDGALRADRGPPAAAVTPGRGAPSPTDALGGAGPGAHRAPRRPLLPPSPVEPLPDARGTFGPRSFLLPDFHFSYLVLSHILCAANGSHFRRPGPSTSSAAAPRLGGLQAAAPGDVSKSRSPPDGETSTWEASLKAAPCARDPGVGPAPRPGPAEAPPLRKNRRTLLARVSRTWRPALWRPFSRVSAAAQCPDASSAARERGVRSPGLPSFGPGGAGDACHAPKRTEPGASGRGQRGQGLLEAAQSGPAG